MEDSLVDDWEESNSRPPQLSILCLILLSWAQTHRGHGGEGAGLSSEPWGHAQMPAGITTGAAEEKSSAMNKAKR